MARKNSFKKAYVGIVMDMALARSKISNRMVAQRLDIDEGTIRNWRKEYRDFDRAFTEARDILREKINSTARNSLDVRKRKTVTKGPKGLQTTVEEVLPTHNDIAVFSSKLGIGATIHSTEDAQRETLKSVMRQKVSGKITALEAAQLLEAEGIEVPKTLIMELTPAAKSPTTWLSLSNGVGVAAGGASSEDFTVRFIGMPPSASPRPDGEEDGNSA